MDSFYYQYKKINKYLYTFLETYQLYLSTPASFNDTFECKFSPVAITHKHLLNFINLTNASHLSEMNSKYSRINLLELFWKSSKNLGICCFTKNCDNILMWAHYADNNRGVCLKFDFNDDIEIEQHIYPVKYVNKRPSYNFIKNPLEVFKFYATKFKIWQYEKEYRLIIPNERKKNIQKHHLKAVIFGSAVSLYHQNKIKKLITNSNPHVLFYQAKEDMSDYKLNILEL